MNDPLAITYALREEIKPFLRGCRILEGEGSGLSLVRFSGRSVILCKTGIGLEKASAAVRRLADHRRPSLILSVGCAGGTFPTQKCGDLLVVSEVWEENRPTHFEVDPGGKRLIERSISPRFSFQSGPLVSLRRIGGRREKEIWGRRGAFAVDMETAAIAAVARTREIPLVSLRVILDTVEEEIPSEEPYDEGHPVRYLMRNPGFLPKIPRYFRMNRICQKNLCGALERIVELLDQADSDHHQQRPRQSLPAKRLREK